ncbi:TVP38/TMEM64 family protein [Halomarina litorea]|uniref:TVP38/TMEM64 family protein n=1 Tax=Halomarina litorea TaxID=2961595 RepID=UPI0020C25A15|nr:TVP38/TMEM64 family protein [Halomarina sp. BCD28]
MSERSAESGTSGPSRPAHLFADARSRRTTLLLVVAVVGLTLVGAAVLRARVSALSDPVAVRAFVAGFGVWAPVAFVCLQAAQVVVAPVPGQVLGFVSGYLFGVVAGTAYSLLGATIGSYVVFRFSRAYGRPYVERALDPDALGLFDDFGDEQGLLAIFLVFLVPGLPDDAVCFLAGLTDIDLSKLVAASLVGRAPGYFLANLAGAQVADAHLAEGLLVVAALVALTLVGYLRREALLAAVAGR